MNDNKYNIEDKIVGALSGQATQEELAELRQWLAENDDNRRLFDEYAAIWSAVGRNDDYNPDVAWTAFNKRIRTCRRLITFDVSQCRKIMAIAAMMVLVFLAGMAVSDKKAIDDNPPGFTEYTSPYGSKSMVKLPDGSTIWLNAGSTLRYSSDFNQRCREVYLEGEGYFDVARNKQTPFLVQTSTITIKVLGTAFNVKAYPEEMYVETTVERGAVQLISSSHKKTVLRAQQKAIVENIKNQDRSKDGKSGEICLSDNEVEVNSNIATEVYTSWKDKRWVIERERLANLVVKLERRYNVHFVFDDEELKDYVFSGKLEDETLFQVLETIKLTAPILYEVNQNTVYLSLNKTFVN